MRASENELLAAARTSLTIRAIGPVFGRVDPLVSAVPGGHRRDHRAPQGRPGGRVSQSSFWLRFVTSRPLTTEPSTATPATAPSSRLVLTTDAAIPDRAAGHDSQHGRCHRHHDHAEAGADEERATIRTARRPECGVQQRVGDQDARRRRSTQPAVIGMPGPTLATHRPLSAEARIITVAIGRKSTATS